MNSVKIVQKEVSSKDKVKVEPFLSFGNEDTVFVKGRVITSYKQKRPNSRNSWLKNIIASIRRYSVKSIPNALVEIHLHDQKFQVRTDEEGVFEKQIEVKNPYSVDRLEHVNFKVLEPEEKINSTWITREVKRFSERQGVISDIDDTVLISHSTDIGKKFWLSISKNAYTRRPLPGVSEFYKELTRHKENPIFYVSSSDWSIYDLIRDFMRYRHIPMGPTLLKDKHLNLRNIWKSGHGNHDHKKDKIEFLFRFFPGMHFFLVGDSGQEDPEIYTEIIKKFPGRVTAVFIRLVDELDPERKQKLESQVSLENYFFFKTSKEALELAKENQFI
ncbi:App1 family protein [Algoriphagus halophilus]|uniref:Phosphatidate phosphatase APP1 n=1 Tax=Algoriphagus halophilus TaxID=226505 RepID=A0A1N6ENU1_9BACT|nr:phosphatase domain-containing protein [Algoriphagus halophilus]SIN84664.1 Phosphatidate phosphatase APP1 [Algoriphagus halophilus]